MRKQWKAALMSATTVLLATPAFAADGATDMSKGWIAMAAGLGIGMAAVGAGLGQGRDSKECDQEGFHGVPREGWRSAFELCKSKEHAKHHHEDL